MNDLSHTHLPLPLRRVRINFEGVPFAWHPSRPNFGRAANAVSWAAVVFEKRLCAVFREALPLIENPHLMAECEAFIAQEATHSRVHKGHVRALVEMHLELEGLMGELEGLAETYLSRLDLIERLAFGATVEGWLAPLGHYLVAERERLFADADIRVTALFLWHFCEEIEHRSTALKLYRHLRPRLGAPWYLRQRAALKTLKLSRVGSRLISRYFAEAGLGSAGRMELPLGAPLAKLLSSLVASHFPSHDTGGAASPDWAQHYLSRIQKGLGPVEALAGVGGVARSGVI